MAARRDGGRVGQGEAEEKIPGQKREMAAKAGQGIRSGGWKSGREPGPARRREEPRYELQRE